MTFRCEKCGRTEKFIVDEYLRPDCSQFDSSDTRKYHASRSELLAQPDAAKPSNAAAAAIAGGRRGRGASSVCIGKRPMRIACRWFERTRTHPQRQTACRLVLGQPCQARPGFDRLLLSASIFFSRALSLTAVLQIIQSRRSVSRASMKSSGKSGPH